MPRTKTAPANKNTTWMDDLRLILGPGFTPCREDVPPDGEVYSKVIGGKSVERMRGRSRMFKGSPNIPNGIVIGHEVKFHDGRPIDSVPDVSPEQMQKIRRFAYGEPQLDWKEVVREDQRRVAAAAQKARFGVSLNDPQQANLDAMIDRKVEERLARMEAEARKNAGM